MDVAEVCDDFRPREYFKKFLELVVGLNQNRAVVVEIVFYLEAHLRLLLLAEELGLLELEFV